LVISLRETTNFGTKISSTDLSLGKVFNIPKWESAHFEIRMDATNFLNHPSFGLPNNQLSAAALASGIANPSAGQVTALSNDGRTMQAYRRFSFLRAASGIFCKSEGRTAATAVLLVCRQRRQFRRYH
jgi:hypothetical protein